MLLTTHIWMRSNFWAMPLAATKPGCIGIMDSGNTILDFRF